MRDPDWIVPDWPAPAKVGALITTRAGGESTGPYASFNLGLRCGDEAPAVAANRRRLAQCLPQNPKWLAQIHGATVVNVDGLDRVPQADASVARQPGTVCAALIADCMPVLLCDRPGRVVGIAHAGWRGLAAGVIENTVQGMAADPATLMAYLGPCIGPGAFEVGADVRDAFLARDAECGSAFIPHRPGKWLADLYALGRRALGRAGVHEVFGGGFCTYSDPRRFFSFRRERTTGRMAALVWLEP